MSRRGLLAIALVAAACHHAKGPTAASCREAGAHVADAMRAVRPALAAAEVDPAPEVTAQCTEDAWAPKVVACYKDALTPRQPPSIDSSNDSFRLRGPQLSAASSKHIWNA